MVNPAAAEAGLADVVTGLRLDAVGCGPALLVAVRRAAVVWANTAALRVFSADSCDDLAVALFRSGPTARSFANRLARVDEQPRLERLLLSHLWPPTPVTASCMAVASYDDEPLALIRLEATVASPDSPRASDTAKVPRSHGASPGTPAVHGRAQRLLWEADRDGIVTHVGPGAGGVEMSDVLTVGEHVASRLRRHAPELADRFERALQDNGSIGATRLAWPRQGSDKPVEMEIGCASPPGRNGLRGFLIVQGAEQAPLATDPIASDATAYAPSPTPENPDPLAATVVAKTASACDSAEALTAAKVTDDAGQVAAPLDAAGLRDALPGGNVVHFPALRLAPVPLKVSEESRLAPDVPLGPDARDLEPPRWSESPGSLPDALTTDEQDAFAHIAQVLGTRRSPGESAAHREPAPTLPEPPSDPAPRDAVRELLGALPTGILLRRGDVFDANPALLKETGDVTASDFRARFRDLDPTEPGVLTRMDGTRMPADVVEVMIEERPARLLIVTPDVPFNATPRSDDAELQIPGTILDAVTDGFMTLDPAGVIVAASAKAADLLGRERAGLVGHRLSEILSLENDPTWGAVTGGQTHVARTRADDPVPLTLEIVSCAPGLLCLLSRHRTSETAPAETEPALREAERTSALKSEFLAKVSHEIRTPLNAILGFAEVIRDERLGPVGNSRYLEYLRDIHASGTHVMSLVNDLLDLSRMEAGRMDLQLEAVDVNAIVQSCVNTLQTQAHRGRIIMRLSLAPHLPTALADTRSLRQIVLNLLSNAVKFNEPGGQVIVSTAPSGRDAVAIRIRDTGIGMSDDEIVAAMEPFRQLSTINRTGSGLGLPLTKALVEANCASMAIKSTQGEGTLVEVAFPVVEPNSVSLPA